MATVSLQGENQELFSGVLHKVGGKVKSWNKRFFVLKSDYCLYYYKDTSKGALGTISLRDPKFNARKGEAGDMSWPRQTKLDCTMAIVTSHRTYCVYCEFAHEIEEWIRVLTKTKEKVIGQFRAENKLLSGARSSSSSLVEPSQQQKEPPNSKTQANYEVVYDAPGNKNTDQNEAVSNNPEAVYALASPEAIQDQVLYEDIGELHSVLQQPISEEITPNVGELYEEVPPEQITQDTVGELYQDVPPDASLNGQITQDLSSLQDQPLYDEISVNQQPLYESMQDELSEDQDHIGQADQESNSADGNNFSPPIPPRIDVPPLPPRPEILPPLPPKVDEETSQSVEMPTHSPPPTHPKAETSPTTSPTNGSPDIDDSPSSPHTGSPTHSPSVLQEEEESDNGVNLSPPSPVPRPVARPRSPPVDNQPATADDEPRNNHHPVPKPRLLHCKWQHCL